MNLRVVKKGEAKPFPEALLLRGEIKCPLCGCEAVYEDCTVKDLERMAIIPPYLTISMVVSTTFATCCPTEGCGSVKYGYRSELPIKFEIQAANDGV
jgi:hypothetical protein